MGFCARAGDKATAKQHRAASRPDRSVFLSFIVSLLFLGLQPSFLKGLSCGSCGTWKGKEYLTFTQAYSKLAICLRAAGLVTDHAGQSERSVRYRK